MDRLAVNNIQHLLFSDYTSNSSNGILIIQQNVKFYFCFNVWVHCMSRNIKQTQNRFLIY